MPDIKDADVEDAVLTGHAPDSAYCIAADSIPSLASPRGFVKSSCTSQPGNSNSKLGVELGINPSAKSPNPLLFTPWN